MYQRSHSLLSPENSMMLIVDVQERLMPVINDKATVLCNTRRLLDGARALNIPVVVSEQYPQGLGSTLPEIVRAFPDKTPVIPKKSFSVCACEALYRLIEANQSPKVVLAGVETHVCVLQTAFDLLAMGREVILAADAVGSRWKNDRDTAFRRMESSGVVLATTESILFEWCQTAENASFKTISALARETP